MAMKSYADIEDIVDKAKEGTVDGAAKVGDVARETAADAWSSALAFARKAAVFLRGAREKGMDDAFGALGFVRKPGMGVAVGSFGAGLAVGAGLGLLFAPKSGAETRHILYRAADDLFSTTKDKFFSTKNKVSTVAKKFTERAHDAGANAARENGAYPS
jgi:hypothetical protein